MSAFRSNKTSLLAFVAATCLLWIFWSRPLAWDRLPDVSGPADRPDVGVSVASHPAAPARPVDVASSDFDPKHPADASAPGSPGAADAPSRPGGQAAANAAHDDAQGVVAPPKADCPKFEAYMNQRPGPPSAGFRQFPLVRPPAECRTFSVPAVDDYISRMQTTIKDPDLFRLFENSFPNTLDTMVRWHGYAQDADGKPTDQELSYIITGDIDAMWLRDSASQLYSYRSFLDPDDHHHHASRRGRSLNSLWRGLINAHSRYIIISPYCHAFQPPPESGVPPTYNAAFSRNHPFPAYDPKKVFDCKWELDSLASFLQVSVAYWQRTHDLAFFAKYSWVDAVAAAVKAAGDMRLGTYDEAGQVQPSAWTFTGWTDRGSETLTNNGLGNPVKTNGMVRTAFRPSDDATIFQLLVPANMMWAKYLEEASAMMEQLAEGKEIPLDDKARRETARILATEMRDFALGIRRGIDRDAIVTHREFGDILAYEVDGFGSVHLMDDSNIPSLLAMPLFDYATTSLQLQSSSSSSTSTSSKHGNDYAKIYQNTRKFVLSGANPYFMRGPAISAVGGPHVGPGKAWPMAALVAGLTALLDDGGDASETEAVVREQLGMVINSTSGTGVVHESVESWDGQVFTRAWFGWANGLLGELIIGMEGWDRGKKSGGGSGMLGWSWQ